MFCIFFTQFYFATAPFSESVLRSSFWLTKSFLFLQFFFLHLASFLGGGGAYISFILVQLKRTQGALDTRIAVHSYTGPQMLISWTLGLQSMA